MRIFSIKYQARRAAEDDRPATGSAHRGCDVVGHDENGVSWLAAGARIGAGANWFASRYFMFVFEGEYHAVGHFEHPDALTEKPSGFGLSMGFGFAWDQ